MAFSAHADAEQVRERFDSPEELSAKLDKLAVLVRSSGHMVAFTGAGISTSAGIPDFRGPQGKWTREAQGKEPVRGISTVKALPTPTHMALVALQKRGKLKYLISQNCDGLHRRSGYPAHAISELHGNSNMEICETCGSQYMRDIACHRFTRGRDHFTGRFCSRPGCGGALVEYTIDFGQSLPSHPLRLAEKHAGKADLHLVLGSSLTVSPACDMPRTTAKSKGLLVIVNLQNTPLDNLATLRIYAKTDTVMQGLMQRLQWDIPPFRLLRRLIVGMERVSAPPPPGGPDHRLFLQAVDFHDPSLQLSLLRGVRWVNQKEQSSENKAPDRLNPKKVPLTISWTGHYGEPDLQLNLDLTSQPLQDIQLSYDPASRRWSSLNANATAIARMPEPSAAVKLQAEHGLDYIRSHRQYVSDLALKRDSSLSKAQCEALADAHMTALRTAQRRRVIAAKGKDVPHSMSSALVRIAPGTEEKKRTEDSPSPQVERGPSMAQLIAAAQARKQPIGRLPGEFRKVATDAQFKAMREHSQQCSHKGCMSVWQGPWGPFLGGAEGRTHFDLTTCALGAKLNAVVGWDVNNPRV